MNPGLIGYLIGLAFAVYWLRLGAVAVGGTHGTIIFVAGTLVILGALWRIRPGRSRRTPGARFRIAYYLIAVAAEIVALNVAIMVLPASILAGYQAPVVGTIVGLHFIGLWAATNMKRFLYLSAGMTTINLAAFALPPDGTPTILAGLGSAAMLAVTVAA